MTYSVIEIIHKGADREAYARPLEAHLDTFIPPLSYSDEFIVLNWLGSIYGAWIEENTGWDWFGFYRVCVHVNLDYDPLVSFGFDDKNTAILFKLTFGGAA